MAKKDEFDILTFFIYVMVLLTVIVGGFAAWNRSRVSKEARKIRGEIRNLKEMQKLGLDQELRGWIAKDREGQATGKKGTVSDFKTILLNGVRRNRLNLISQTQEGFREHRGGKELPFRLRFRRCRVEQLVRFLVYVEEAWPGARVKKIVELNYIDRAEPKGWDASVVISIFRQN